jgi:hypothetical protein
MVSLFHPHVPTVRTHPPMPSRHLRRLWLMDVKHLGANTPPLRFTARKRRPVQRSERQQWLKFKLLPYVAAGVVAGARR